MGEDQIPSPGRHIRVDSKEKGKGKGLMWKEIEDG